MSKLPSDEAARETWAALKWRPPYYDSELAEQIIAAYLTQTDEGRALAWDAKRCRFVDDNLSCVHMWMLAMIDAAIARREGE